MEGVHRLAQAAALMTRPSETFAQLTRQIAELVGATKAWLALWDPETRSLVATPPGFGVPDEALRGVGCEIEMHWTVGSGLRVDVGKAAGAGSGGAAHTSGPSFRNAPDWTSGQS